MIMITPRTTSIDSRRTRFKLALASGVVAAVDATGSGKRSRTVSAIDLAVRNLNERRKSGVLDHAKQSLALVKLDAVTIEHNGLGSAVGEASKLAVDQTKAPTCSNDR